MVDSLIQTTVFVWIHDRPRLFHVQFCSITSKKKKLFVTLLLVSDTSTALESVFEMAFTSKSWRAATLSIADKSYM